MPEIAFENVNLYYGKGKKREDPVKGLSLVLPDGGINVILGPSGSGKTTILRSLVDACEHEGTIKLGGKDIRGIALEKRNVRYVSQTITLYPHMTVFENIAFPLLSAHLPPRGGAQKEPRGRQKDGHIHMPQREAALPLARPAAKGDARKGARGEALAPFA